MRDLRRTLISAMVLCFASQALAQEKPTDDPIEPGPCTVTDTASGQPTMIEKEIVPDAGDPPMSSAIIVEKEIIEPSAVISSQVQPADDATADASIRFDESDLIELLGSWGAAGQGNVHDFNGDGVINGDDLRALLSGQNQGLNGPIPQRTCGTEPAPGSLIIVQDGIAGNGGGMNGNGWDGAGQEDWVLSWHVDNTTGDFAASGQRAALIAAMQAWANVVQISFIEYPVSDLNDQVDWTFYTDNHCAAEPVECGDPDCSFGGAGGTLAHAMFPPGAGSLCGGTMAETNAGNVHFDEAETWEQNTGSSTSLSLTLIACHEVGHAIGLIHSTGATDVMRASFNGTDSFNGLSQNDIDNIRLGYGAGTGTFSTLEQTGVWVNLNAGPTQFGTVNAPFATVPQGVGGVPPGNSGVVLHIQAGTYFQTVFADKPMTMRAENGTVRIGGN